jgi:BMFP domain-containing protein YqiC
MSTKVKQHIKTKKKKPVESHPNTLLTSVNRHHRYEVETLIDNQIQLTLKKLDF